MSSFNEGFLSPKKDGIIKKSVKSIQRGNGTGSITINAVDINKTLVRTPGTGGNSYVVIPYARLVSATSIDVGYGLSGATIDWEVIEFNKIKSIQRGSSTTSPVTISGINPNKASVFFSIKATSGTAGYAYGQPVGKINSSTSIAWGLACGSSISATAYWTVIEWM